MHVAFNQLQLCDLNASDINAAMLTFYVKWSEEN